MTQDMATSGTGRNVVYTLKVETDPGAKAELQKFKQSVQEVFKDIGARQAEVRDQAMRGPQINIERMQSQTKRDQVRRNHDLFQQATEGSSPRIDRDRQTTFQVGMPNQASGPHLEYPASDALAGDIAPMLATGQPMNRIHTNPAGTSRGITSSPMAAGDRNSGDLQKSISTVINALTNLAQALGSADQGANSHRNALLQRANRDAAFG